MMFLSGRRCIRTRVFPAFTLFVAVCVAAVSGVQASSHFIIKKDGRKIALTRCEDEIAVTFSDVDSIKSAATRLASKGHGVVEDLQFAPDSSIKRVRVAHTTREAIQAIRDNAQVKEIHAIYHIGDSDAPLISTGTINLRLKKSLDDAARNNLWRDYRVAAGRAIEGLSDVYVVSLLDADDDEVLRAQALAVDSRVVWAEPNFRLPVDFRQVTPSDPLFSLQWHLNNTGQVGGVAGSDINVLDAWEIAQGQDVLFGMFDDSCDVTHEDLRGGYIGVGHDPSFPSTSSEFRDPRPKDFNNFHGTPVMGLAVAQSNSLGGRGVAPLARFTASRGLSAALTDEDIAGAYTFARQQDVDVHINSWGLPGIPTPQVLADAIETAFQEGRDLDGADGVELPRGMVVVFASGNSGVQLFENDDFSTLPTVIGVGASDRSDGLAFFSNFGKQVDLIAPGEALILSTDNDDQAGYVDPGLNFGGIGPFGDPDVDPVGLYTGEFSGTSAACPIAAGVAGLILSANSDLSATDVRLVMEHASERVSPTDAQYDPITKRSLRYGYGRIDATVAAQAALDSINTGRTWPGRVGDVLVAETRLSWRQNGNQLEFRFAEIDLDTDDDIPAKPVTTTNEYLVVSSDSPFTFDPEVFPIDGECYSRSQLGCGDSQASALVPLPAGVEIQSVGCGCPLVASAVDDCDAGSEQCIDFLAPTTTKHFGIFARNTLGRYSWGVKADTNGNILDPGEILDSGGGLIVGGGDGSAPVAGPKVSIDVSPREGTAPLAVRFAGNASSDIPIDDSRTAWDFDINDSIIVDATSRSATHTYDVPAGQSQTFIARLTMFDTDGNAGFAQVSIRVDGPGTDDAGSQGNNGVRIIIGIPTTIGSDVDSGVSPFSVRLELDTSGLVGALQSVRWDLGDGTTSSSLFVTHTYVNETNADLRLPITATITTLTTGGTTLTTNTSRTITIFPGTGLTDDTDVPPLDGTGAQGPGGTATPCGAMGILPMFALAFSMLWFRRRRW